MDPRKIGQTIDKNINAVRLIAIAFAASVLLYGTLAYLLIGVLGHQSIVEVPLYLAVAISVLQLLLILAGWLISLSMRTPRRGSAAAAAVADEAMQRYTRSVVVAAALREAASIVGLLLTVLTADMTWVLLLGGAALISMLVHWPRRAAIEDFLQQQGRTR